MSPSRRSFRVPPRIIARLAAYYAVGWGTLIAVAPNPVWRIAVAALAAYTILPLVVFLRFGGWPFYPVALFRIFVVRTFLYASSLFRC